MTELKYLDITKTAQGHITVPSVQKAAPSIMESIPSTPIASFSDGAENCPVEDLVVDINPVQSGSGDPSPSNVRPITGWTGMNVYRTGKNLLKNKIEGRTNNGVTYTANDDGTITLADTATGASYLAASMPYNSTNKAKFTFLKAGTYTLTGGISNAIRIYLVYSPVRDPSTGASLTSDVGSGSTFTIPEDAYVYLQIAVTNGTATNVTIKPMLVAGSTGATFEENTATAYPITWSDTAGTVYGGYLNPVTGVLTVTDGNIASYNGETLPSTWISDRDVYAAGTTPTTGAQVVYELATPQTYQLTPTEVKTLLGENNIWADTGNVAVDYFADTKKYIDKVLNA